MENNSYKDLYNVPLLAEYGIKDVNIITKAWQESHRFYHTEKHLADLLLHIDELSIDDRASQEERNILQIVAYFHDIVYDPKAADNEDKSATFFRKYAPNHPNTELIAQIILDTKYHTPSNKLSEVFCDLDMKIVKNSTVAELLEWEKNIFREYQFYDYSMYKMGRIALLENFKDKYPENSQNLQFLIDYLKVFRPKIGIYPGSFNPFHNGHLNILQKAARIFDKVILAKGVNPEKENQPANTAETIDNQILRYTQIDTFKGLLVMYMQEKEADADVTLIRGLRNGDDLDYEMNQLRFMRDMKPDLKTIFINCDIEFEHISSSAIRNLEKIGKGFGLMYVPR